MELSYRRRVMCLAGSSSRIKGLLVISLFGNYTFERRGGEKIPQRIICFDIEMQTETYNLIIVYVWFVGIPPMLFSIRS